VKVEGLQLEVDEPSEEGEAGVAVGQEGGHQKEDDRETDAEPDDEPPGVGVAVVHVVLHHRGLEEIGEEEMIVAVLPLEMEGGFHFWSSEGS
jgi:hypothetical protein